MSADEVRSYVVETVNDAWKKEEKPVLLSVLGSGLEGGVSRFAKSNHGTLRDYIKEVMSDTLSVIQHSRNPVVVAAVPKTAETADNVDQMLDELRRAGKTESHQFRRSFWAAFRKSLPLGMVRFLKIDAPNNFEDMKTGTPVLEGYVEITSNFIAESNTANDSDVYGYILRWCDAQKFSPEKFIVTFSSFDSSNSSVLSRIFDTLDDEDLKRVIMPLDVVQKLVRSDSK